MSELSYEHERIDPAEPVAEPDYGRLVSWAADASGAATCLDFWARGNYVRRLLWQRQNGLQPVVLVADTFEKLCWGYQRLALLGLPIELIYTGTTLGEGRVVHLHPRDDPVDCGWGYLAATQDCHFAGRDWFPVIGWCDLLPETVAEWLLLDNREAFTKGRVMLAPGSHVGVLQAIQEPMTEALCQIVGAPAVVSPSSCEALLTIDLPYLEGLPPRDFDRFIADHQEDLGPLREALGALLGAASVDGASARRLADAISDIVRSSSHARMREFASKLGGSVRTFPVALGALAGASAIYSGDPFAGVAAAGVAFHALRSLWVSTKSVGMAARGSLRLLIELGATAPPGRRNRGAPREVSVGFEPPRSAYHWLCPPSGGMHWAFVREKV